MPDRKRIIGRDHSPGPQSNEERQQIREIRQQAMEEFPPLDPPKLQRVTNGLGAQIRAAREAQGLTWYSLAEKARIPSADIVRDIEYGRDVTLSNIESVVTALGLKLELVQQP